MTITRRAYGKGHSYYVDGVKFDGVTTLLKDGIPKPALMYWAARTVAEHVADATEQHLAELRQLGRGGMVAALKETPWQQAGAAAVKGTEVHTLAEHLVAGEQVDVPEHLAGYVESCVAFLDRYRVVPLAIERPVANRRWRYAGTPDLFAQITLPSGEVVRCVLDWKTGASGVWPEAALQCAAYRHAEVWVNEAGEEWSVPDIGLTAGYAVWLRPDGADLIPLDTSEQVFKTFQHVTWLARQLREAKSWVGAAIQPEEVHA